MQGRWITFICAWSVEKLSMLAFMVWRSIQSSQDIMALRNVYSNKEKLPVKQKIFHIFI